MCALQALLLFLALLVSFPSKRQGTSLLFHREMPYKFALDKSIFPTVKHGCTVARTNGFGHLAICQLMFI